MSDELTASLVRKIADLESRLDKLGQRARCAGRWVHLAAPLTSTAWDGDARSTEGVTPLDLSDVFGVPAGVKAILLRVDCRDSGSAADSVYFYAGPTATAYYQVVNRPPGGDLKRQVQEVCNCDGGNIYYRIGASAGGSMDVWLEIWGYYV